MVLGQKEGFKLLQKFPQYSCLMVTDKGKVVKSANFKIKDFKAKF
jgi:thiamine biosynthesis lipoprotein